MKDNFEILTVEDVEYVKDYILRILFSNGVTKQVDVLPLLNGAVFEPLKDKNNFIQFGLTGGTIEWYNGADFAPEYLYKIGVPA
ncbi:MAG: DUF2442 domain-containing protein [Alistipes sp.]|uniref:DUF2442 domain-containing protein n=1 Tax=Alistipes sp. TaxID=1872444 RepID=UPI0011C7A511